MILHGAIARAAGNRRILKVTSNGDLPQPLRGPLALIVDESSENICNGFGAVLARHVAGEGCIQLPEHLGYISDGDVVRVTPSEGEIRVLYRANSKHNSLLLTERCNSNCLMCSQPPRDSDDSILVDDALEAIGLMSRATPELGITGGEPTLTGEGFYDVILRTKQCLPNTALHVLTNGRSFQYLANARRVARIQHPNMVLGIPLYSDVGRIHDFVVQSSGAFDETVRGLLNLARVGVRVELRVVLHRESVGRLPELARFIARNLPFVEHVALMGIEPIGFAKQNWATLWVDPTEYQDQLRMAVDVLRNAHVPAWIFNHQLCLLPTELWSVSVKSISDWKNVYVDACGTCEVRQDCGGFFSWAPDLQSKNICPVTK